MKNPMPNNISAIFIILASSYLTYRLLLCDNFLHTSISEIINYSHNLAITKHLLILGLLPIYIGAIIFGAAIFGIYLWSILQQVVLSKRSK